MPTRPSPDPMDSMWDWTSHDLRLYRIRRNLSGQDVAKILNCARSSISRLETGEARMDEDQAAALDNAWNTGGHFLRLVTYAQLGHDPDWRKQYRQYEQKAEIIQIYDGQLVPGLLQTPAYARALLVAGRVVNVDTFVDDRMRRQDILNQPDPPELSILLDEAVIDRPVGGAATMREQLARLLEMAELPNITLRVIPKSAGAYPGLDGPFKVISIRGQDRDIAFVEAPHGGRLVLGSREVRRFRKRYEWIGAHALPVDSTPPLIERLMESMQ